MKLLIDSCAGRRLAAWLRAEGHDVAEVWALGTDPGDRAILALAATERRILVTMDKDFGLLIFAEDAAHAGLVRLPRVRSTRRIDLMRTVLNDYAEELAAGSVITVQENRVRVSHREQL